MKLKMCARGAVFRRTQFECSVTRELEWHTSWPTAGSGARKMLTICFVRSHDMHAQVRFVVETETASMSFPILSQQMQHRAGFYTIRNLGEGLRLAFHPRFPGSREECVLVVLGTCSRFSPFRLMPQRATNQLDLSTGFLNRKFTALILAYWFN